ncbi:MAG: hypothetical protein NVS4B12_15010 [Ktedonobacteraceae bacterium]
MDKLNTLAKLLWVTGGVLCLMVFVYQATPILLNAMEAAWLQPLGICLMYTILFVLISGTLFGFAWLLEKLNDLRDYHKTRKIYRDLNIQLRRQALQKHNRQSHYRTRLEIYRQRRRPLWRHSSQDWRRRPDPDE